MAEIARATKIWVVTQTASRPIVAAGFAGTPEPLEPAPILNPTAYIQARLGTDITAAKNELNADLTVPLIAMLPSPDGPPITQALLFNRIRDTTISYEMGGRSYLGHWAIEYEAARFRGGYIWDSDLAEKLYGCFLIGGHDESSLWRIRRAQADHLGRSIFTLQPVRPVGPVPEPDFSAITDEMIRKATQSHWDDMVHALAANRASAVVTSAKQVAENVLYFELVKAGHIGVGNHEFAQLLRRLKATLEDAERRSSAPFTDLDYHLMQKLRILHGGTHVGRLVINGRAISDEYGLSAALDLVEILTSIGMIR